ncbi:MAG: PRC-barrel domain-containing protein [Candidatus Micrarchaeota archaeon]|nr:PRC-barrel domain-containing protein [Candidatus Micrarchaeota archaeon]
MAKIVLAKQLAGKKIITNDGEDLGRLVDLEIVESSGKIENILLEPNLDNPTARRLNKEDGLVVIPYASVLAASDHIIVDKKTIG